MAEKYEELLDNIYSNLPEKATKAERFDIPKFKYFTEGNKTIISNFKTVSSKLRREPKFISKYFSKELAVPVEIQGERLILQRKISDGIIDKKLEEFIKKYVMCKECKRPDTHIEDLGHGHKMLVCESCGARNPLR